MICHCKGPSEKSTFFPGVSHTLQKEASGSLEFLVRLSKLPTEMFAQCSLSKSEAALRELWRTWKWGRGRQRTLMLSLHSGWGERAASSEDLEATPQDRVGMRVWALMEKTGTSFSSLNRSEVWGGTCERKTYSSLHRRFDSSPVFSPWCDLVGPLPLGKLPKPPKERKIKHD